MMPPATNPYEDYTKTGAKRLIQLAKVCCALVQRFKAIIIANFPDNGAIINLLIAIETVCTFIPAAEAEYQEFALNQAIPTDVVEDIKGYDPSAPEALPPDYEIT